MGSLKAQILLLKVAKQSERRKKSFSKQEILKKINEIKYLSAQKKVPKLSLRKQILHLESKLEGIFEMEKELLKKKKHESAKITSLKRQIAGLKVKLGTSKDKHLHKKVDKLSHILGENLAKKQSSKLVKEQKQLAKKKKNEEAEREKNIEIFQKIYHRFTEMQHELDIVRSIQDTSPVIITNLQKKVNVLREKIRDYQEKHPECMVQEIRVEVPEQPIQQVQHQVMFDTKVVETPLSLDFSKINQQAEEELPLPPPPKIRA